MSELDLAGKNCIVTGATGGLGRCIVKHLWSRGANLMLVGRSHQLPVVLASEKPVVAEQSVSTYYGDLSHPDVAADTLEAELLQWSVAQVDVLINVAAILGPIGPLEQNDWADWERTIKVNLLAPVALCRAVIPFMKGAGGSIVNLSGGGATKARPNFTAYACAKTALVRFTETLAQEVAPYNIRVNAVAPGRLPTKLNERVMEAGDAVGEEEYEQAARCKDNPNGFHSAERLIGFLVSDASKGITGKLISAVWDDWRNFSESHITEMQERENVFTLRRVTQ